MRSWRPSESVRQWSRNIFQPSRVSAPDAMSRALSPIPHKDTCGPGRPSSRPLVRAALRRASSQRGSPPSLRTRPFLPYARVIVIGTSECGEDSRSSRKWIKPGEYRKWRCHKNLGGMVVPPQRKSKRTNPRILPVLRRISKDRRRPKDAGFLIKNSCSHLLPEAYRKRSCQNEGGVARGETRSRMPGRRGIEKASRHVRLKAAVGMKRVRSRNVVDMSITWGVLPCLRVKSTLCDFIGIERGIGGSGSRADVCLSSIALNALTNNKRWNKRGAIPSHNGRKKASAVFAEFVTFLIGRLCGKP